MISTFGRDHQKSSNMNTQILFGFLALLSAALNAGDLLWLRRGALFAFPRAGFIRIVFIGWTFALPVVALLSLVGFLQGAYCTELAYVYVVSFQVYAILSRHRIAKVSIGGMAS